MNDYFKKVDPDRLVHYEGNFPNPAFEDSISDVKSCMYAPPEEIIDYLENKAENRSSYVNICMTWGIR